MSRSQRHMRFIHGYDSGEYPPPWGPPNEPPQVPPLEEAPPPEGPPVEEGLTLAWIQPDSCTIGDDNLTVLLAGTGFTPESVVETTLGTIPANFVNSTELSWVVNPSAVQEQSVIDVQVKNSDGSLSNSLNFTFNAPSPPPAPVKYK